MSPEAFVAVFEGKLKTDCFLELRMPTSDDLNQAPQDIINRIHAVTSVNATSGEVGFELTGDRGREV